MSQIFDNDKEYIASTYNRFPIAITHGKGSFVYDENGKEYIDLTSGIGVTSFGIADSEWVNAVTAQFGRVQHMSNLYYTEPCVKLAQMLTKKSGMKKVFFSNSGAEANECAIKAARKYAFEHKGADCFNIVTLFNSFHGRTITTLAATGQDVFHSQFLPLTEGFKHVPANDADALKAAVDGTVAAIMLECVQGEGGVIALDESYIKAARQIADENGILLIIDEVQTGNGRTGEMYAYQNYKITPDIVSTAKGLGGGLPLGATLLGEKVQDIFSPGDHGSTFGGNPVACAGACSIVSRIDENLLSDVKRKSKLVFDALQGAKGVKSVSGLGLMIGVETVRPAKEVLLDCMQNGVLCLTAKTKLRLLPALNIPEDVLMKAVEVIKQACSKEN